MRRWLIFGWLLLAVGLRAASGGTSTPPGLSVRNGTLMKGGKPFRAIGADYFSLFYRTLKDPNDTSYKSGLRTLSQAHIPFVRFMCGGFWPTDQKLYLSDKAEYFRRLDRVVRAAEEAHVGLVPSLFWNVATVADLAGEPMDQLGNPRSRSIALIRRYTGDVVRRYKDSPALWGWEFGNECNLAVDLPNASEHRPSVEPQLGTPKERTARDELTSRELTVAFVAFAETVRRFDRTRFITTGDAVPRVSAFHNSNGGTWDPDTEAQFAAILRRDNPDPFDTVCVHIYPDDKNVYAGGAASLDASVGLASEYAARMHKPLFLGEFGAAKSLGPAQERARFTELLAAIVKHRVPLSAFWVFDLAQQDADWNVTGANDRRYMLALVAQANAKLQDGPRR